MKSRFLSRYNILSLLGIVLIAAGVGVTLYEGSSMTLPLFFFTGACAVSLAAVSFLHFTVTKPVFNLKREVRRLVGNMADEKPVHCDSGIEEITGGLSSIYKEVDDARLRVKELEATVNVYAIEKKQMEAILRSLPIAVLVTDRFNELLFSNEVAQRMFLFDGESGQGKAVAEVLQWKELVNLIHGISERKVKVPRRMVELSYQQEGGESKVLRVILSSITDHADRILGVVSIVQDATKDREIDRMKSEFVANVSHELKAPLSSIKAYTEMLSDGEVDDEKTQKEFCGIIESEADRLSNMIDTLLDLSKLEAGVVQVNRGRVNLIKMLKSIENTMRPNAEKKGLSLSTDISQYIVPVHGDKEQLNRVFVNLVSNAIKYTPEGGSVEITSRLEGDLVRVDVSDTGYGIPKEDISKIFEKFYRVKGSSKRAKGTGMGLAMVKRILENHNAEIKVSSAVGKGSRFSAFIPAAD